MTDAPAALPPLAPLHAVLDRLARAGVPCAIGGSALLVSLGLAARARDWDVTTDAAIETLDALFAGVPHERAGPGGVHADHKLVFAGGAVELIARLAFRVEAGPSEDALTSGAAITSRAAPAVCRIPTVIAATWQGLPMASPEAWAVAYALLARDATGGAHRDATEGARGATEGARGAGRPEKSRLLFEHLTRAGADPAVVARLLAEPLPDDLATRLRALPLRPR